MTPPRDSLDSLLILEDEDFVRSAYATILQRAPDNGGLTVYTGKLRLGWSKLQILSELRRSPESREQGRDLEAIDTAIATLAPTPLQKLKRRFMRHHDTERQLRILANQLHRVDQRLAGIQSKMEEAARAAAHNRAESAVHYVPGTAHLVQPQNELALDQIDRTYWVSLGHDPHFKLMFANGACLEPGWYRVQLSLARHGGRAVSKFYFDSGSGFDEAHSLVYPLTDEEPSSHWYRLTQRALNIRFDPLDRPGRFKIERLSFEPASEPAAVEAMLEELRARHFWYRGKSVTHIRESMHSKALLRKLDLATALLHEYRSIFQAQRITYDEWISTIELPSLPSTNEVKSILAAWPSPPCISLVMPVYNTPEPYLRDCVQSIRRQSFPHWELCIADDASTLPHVRQVLTELAAAEPRIKIDFRAQNGHISAASNSALALATGEFVALIDHDDMLPEHALLFAAQAIAAKPNVAIVYSDEDKLDGNGNRFDPCFKSDWNPDLLLTGNYVSHLGIYRKTLLDRVGGFRVGVEGSQDYDLILRCLPFVQANQIIHVPRILYHWRAIAGSTAASSDAKDYTSQAGKIALENYFETNGPPGVEVEAGTVANTFRIRYPVPDPAPLVSLLIPTRDRVDLLQACVESILQQTTYSNLEILIIDNGSLEERTLNYFETVQKADRRVRVIRYDHPFNYSAINNFGVRHTTGTIIGLINNDVEVISSSWLTEMVSHVVRPEIGCVGAKLYYSDGTIQHAGVICGLGGVACHAHKEFPRDHPGYFGRLMLAQGFSAVTGACLLVRRSVYEEVGGLEEQALAVAFNDVDFCLKVDAAGYRNIWTPYAELYHHESVSRGAEDSPEKLDRFRREIEFMKRKWSARLQDDPYYNPNLTKGREDFSIGL